MMEARKTSGGFTLLELLITVVVIGLLIGFLYPALYATKNAAKRKEIEVTKRTLGSAIRSYHFEYQKWPCPDSHQGDADHTYSNNNYLVIEKLTNTVPPLLRMEDFHFDAQGSLVDRFGGYYSITLDTDYNGNPTAGYEITSPNQ
jgi:prepilin-type N-terminal cleavage/methylation domain-containing protein